MRSLSTVRSPLVSIAAAACGLLATGCTTTSSLELTPRTVQVEHQNFASVQVNATGTGRTFGLGPRKVGSSDLEQAVRTAVLEAGLFQEVALTGGADWILEVTVERLNLSEPGLTMTTDAALRWRLIDVNTDRVRWETLIKESAKAEPEDSPDFGERGKRSIERAIAANVAEGVRRMGALVL